MSSLALQQQRGCIPNRLPYVPDHRRHHNLLFTRSRETLPATVDCLCLAHCPCNQPQLLPEISGSPALPASASSSAQLTIPTFSCCPFPPASIFAFVSLSTPSSVLRRPLSRCWRPRLRRARPVCRTLNCQLIHHLILPRDCQHLTELAKPAVAHGNGVVHHPIYSPSPI